MTAWYLNIALQNHCFIIAVEITRLLLKGPGPEVTYHNRRTGNITIRFLFSSCVKISKNPLKFYQIQEGPSCSWKQAPSKLASY